MQEAQTLPPLVIGHLNALTGSLSYFGVSHGNAADLAASHINRAGGIQGGSVVIINRDTGVNPVQGVDAARALVDVESVAAIVGALASGVTIPVATSVTAPNQTLQISHSSTAPSITALEDDDFLFRTTVSDAAQGVVLGRLAWEQGYRSAGIMYINNAYGQGLAERFTQTFTELGGTVTGSVPHEDSQPTFTSELEKATEGNPDVLVTVSYPGQAEIYLREALEGDYADTFLFVDGVKSDDMVQAIGGGKLDGTLGTAPGAPDSPDRQAFYNAYTLTFGVDAPQEPYLAETYDAVVLIALAAAKAGTTTDSVAIRDALRDVANPPGEVVGPGLAGIQKALSLIASGQDINYEGASGPVDFDENGDVSGPIEVWTVEGDAVKSTGRFELP
ncbi:MAG: ABC transporter substrate-binding protein [bacterium]|nr:ABC transporter substrate-binding protein [bacterium]